MASACHPVLEPLSTKSVRPIIVANRTSSALFPVKKTSAVSPARKMFTATQHLKDACHTAINKNFVSPILPPAAPDELVPVKMTAGRSAAAVSVRCCSAPNSAIVLSPINAQLMADVLPVSVHKMLVIPFISVKIIAVCAPTEAALVAPILLYQLRPVAMV
jgi:hypothetical protein